MCCSSLTAAARVVGAVVAVVVVIFDLVEHTDGGIETRSAGRQRPVEAGEAGCMLVGETLAGVNSKHKRVCHQPVEGTRMMSQLISRERLRSVGRDLLLL